MGQYLCFSPRGVEAAGGAAGVILWEVDVTVGGRAFNGSFDGGYLNGGSYEGGHLCKQQQVFVVVRTGF